MPPTVSDQAINNVDGHARRNEESRLDDIHSESSVFVSYRPRLDVDRVLLQLSLLNLTRRSQGENAIEYCYKVATTDYISLDTKSAWCSFLFKNDFKVSFYATKTIVAILKLESCYNTWDDGYVSSGIFSFISTTTGEIESVDLSNSGPLNYRFIHPADKIEITQYTDDVFGFERPAENDGVKFGLDHGNLSNWTGNKDTAHKGLHKLSHEIVNDATTTQTIAVPPTDVGASAFAFVRAKSDLAYTAPAVPTETRDDSSLCDTIFDFHGDGARSNYVDGSELYAFDRPTRDAGWLRQRVCRNGNQNISPNCEARKGYSCIDVCFTVVGSSALSHGV